MLQQGVKKELSFRPTGHGIVTFVMIAQIDRMGVYVMKLHDDKPKSDGNLHTPQFSKMAVIPKTKSLDLLSLHLHRSFWCQNQCVLGQGVE